MARTPKKTGAKTPAVRHDHDHVVCGQIMEAAYHVADLHPKAEGPWRREAEKLAWTDPQTGLSCIIRRDLGGHLAGFVAIERDHPLYGFDARAIPRTVIHAHAGLSFSDRCDADGPEELSICHVSGRRAAHDDKWWLGFACDSISDFIPGLPAHAAEARDLGIEQFYRDERYVFTQVTDLAAQLAALAADEEDDA